MKKLFCLLSFALLIVLTTTGNLYADGTAGFDKTKFEVKEIDLAVTSIGEYNDGHFACLKRHIDDNNKISFYFIDKDGKIINQIHDMRDRSGVDNIMGYYKTAKIEDIKGYDKLRECYIDKDGNLLFGRAFYKIRLTKHGYAFVQENEGDKIYLVDLKGNILREYPNFERFVSTNIANYFMTIEHTKINGVGRDIDILRNIDGKEVLSREHKYQIAALYKNFGISARMDGNEEYLMLDYKGNIIYPNFRKEKIVVFKNALEGISLASKNHKYGLVDYNEKILVPFEYDDAYYLGEKRFSFKKGEEQIITDEKGQILKKVNTKDVGVIQAYSEGVYIGFLWDNAYKYFDEDFKPLSNQAFVRIQSFKDGYSIAKTWDKVFIIKHKNYKTVEEEVEALAKIEQDPKFKGKKIVDVLSVSKNDTGKTLQDIDVKWVDSKYRYYRIYSDKGIFIFDVKNNGVIGGENRVLIGEDGKAIENIEYFSLKGLDYDENNISITKPLGLFNYYVLDDYGKIKIGKKTRYTRLFAHPEDNCYKFEKKVGYKYLWGIMDLNGKIMVDAKYDDMMNLQYGKAVVRLKNKIGVIDIKNGNVIVDFKYDSIRLSKDVIAVRKDNKWSLIDNNGKRVSDKEYDLISPFNSNNLAAVVSGSENLIIDSKGKVKHKFTEYNANEGVRVVYINDQNKVSVNTSKDIIYVTPDSLKSNITAKSDSSESTEDEENRFKDVDVDKSGTRFDEGVAYLDEKGDKYSRFIDKDGNTILKDEFYKETEFINGIAVIKVYVDDKAQYGIIKLSDIKKLGGIK